MSASTPPPPPPPRRPGQVPRHRLLSDRSEPKASRGSAALTALLSALMIFIGFVLLLPGMCAGVVLVSTDRAFANFFAPWILIGFVISAGGILLIVAAGHLLRSRRN